MDIFVNAKFNLGDKVVIGFDDFKNHGEKFIILQRKYYEDLDGGSGYQYGLSSKDSFYNSVPEHMLSLVKQKA